MNIGAELSCDGVMPSGPASGWPKERHEALMREAERHTERGVSAEEGTPSGRDYGPSFAKMARGAMRTAKQAALHGRVSKEVREERYETCKACPFFDPESKRCKDCGCFMEAKTWVGGDPNTLCPKQKWSR